MMMTFPETISAVAPVILIALIAIMVIAVLVGVVLVYLLFHDNANNKADLPEPTPNTN